LDHSAYPQMGEVASDKRRATCRRVALRIHRTESLSSPRVATLTPVARRDRRALGLSGDERIVE